MLSVVTFVSDIQCLQSTIPEDFINFHYVLFHVSCDVIVVFVQLLNVFKKVPGFKEIRVLGFR